MILCEQCKTEIDGNYGSGRFCNKKCANIWSANQNKEQRSKKIQKTMKKKYATGWSTWSGMTQEEKRNSAKKAGIGNKRKFEKIYESGVWENFPFTLKRRKVHEDQNGKCLLCGINEWDNKPLKLHLDHIDGNKKNNKRKNLRFLCPNCHSQTNTYCGNKQKLPEFEYLKITTEKLNGAIAQRAE